ncbi:MAG: hypothetical protein KC656_08305 [Myxococcales bacterium]|nr:hypothetical protein [Myxococcales bacterium]
MPIVSTDKRVGFILSSGRTGTVFVTRALERHLPGVVSVHEPRGSRTNLVLSNVRNLVGPGTEVVRTRFREGLQRRLDALPAGTLYVEVNPMLVALTDILADEVEPLHLVHLTRDPTDWVRSIRKFRASTKFRPFIDHAPFANPYPSPRPDGWWRASRVERALWRWRYSNERILAIRDRAASYVHLRYEDLFADDRDLQLATLGAAVRTLGVDDDVDGSWLDTSVRENPAPPGERVDVDPALVERICGPLARELGYPS